MAAIYGAPAMLALMALHDRRPLLGAAAVVLCKDPFRHSDERVDKLIASM